MTKTKNNFLLKEAEQIGVDCEGATISVYLVDTGEDLSCRIFLEEETRNFYVEKHPQGSLKNIIYVSYVGRRFKRAEQIATENSEKYGRGDDFSSYSDLEDPDDRAPGKTHSIDGYIC